MRYFEKHGATVVTSIERKHPGRYSRYVSLTSNISESDPLSYEEDVEKQVLKDVITEEYHYILKNDIWNIGPRPERKPIVNSIWIYKIKHDVDGSVEKYKERLVTHGFS